MKIVIGSKNTDKIKIVENALEELLKIISEYIN